MFRLNQKERIVQKRRMLQCLLQMENESKKRLKEKEQQNNFHSNDFIGWNGRE